MLIIYIDADGCAVKDEVYKVAARYKLKVVLVANKFFGIPQHPDIKLQVVDSGFDAADDWIATEIGAGDILITSDLLLADRCIKKKARVLGPKGKELSEDNIGNALGGRELMSHLRQLGNTKTGPSAMRKTDRSQFLATLDQIINSIKKNLK